MIYTVTFSPTLDYVVEIDEFQTGAINRTSSSQVLPALRSRGFFTGSVSAIISSMLRRV